MHCADEFEAVIAPGVTTGELMKECLAKGVCLESDVILPSVTYGGILTTGCHVCTHIAKLHMCECKMLSHNYISTYLLEINIYNRKKPDRNHLQALATVSSYVYHHEYLGIRYSNISKIYKMQFLFW